MQRNGGANRRGSRYKPPELALKPSARRPRAVVKPGAVKPLRPLLSDMQPDDRMARISTNLAAMENLVVRALPKLFGAVLGVALMSVALGLLYRLLALHVAILRADSSERSTAPARRGWHHPRIQVRNRSSQRCH